MEGLDQDLHAIEAERPRMFASSSFLWRVGAPGLAGGTGSGFSGIALYDTLTGQPVLKQYIPAPGMWAYSFNQGVLIGIPPSFNPTGEAVWQSPVTAPVFDARAGEITQSQITLNLPNPSAPAFIEDIPITDTRLFLALQEESGGSQPVMVATYDLSSNPPSLLGTVSVATPGYLEVFGKQLFVGGSLYDISSGMPALVSSVLPVLPEDMSGTLGLIGNFSEHYLWDFSNPAAPRNTGILFNGDDLTFGLARFVGDHNAYVISSGLQIFDVSAPGGQIPETDLRGSGTFAVIYDLLVASSQLYIAEQTDGGPYLTTYDLSRTPPQKISSFAFNNNETPLSLAVDGNYLFVGTSTELVVLDITNPGSPVKVTSLPLPTSALALAGTTLYEGTTDKRLVAIDVTNPTSPVSGASTNLAGFPVTMQVSNNLLLIAADTAGLLTFSVANPSSPVPLSQYQPSSAVEGVALDGNLALLAATDGGFVIADMTNPSGPVLAGEFSKDPLTCFSDLSAGGLIGMVSLFLNNNIAYLGTSNLNGEVFGFDYSTPSHPRIVSVADYGNALAESIYSFAGYQSNLFVAGDLFYDQTVQVDVTQPRNFIRHMCFPPPFGPNAGSSFPQARRRVSSGSLWNPKARIGTVAVGQPKPDSHGAE